MTSRTTWRQWRGSSCGSARKNSLDTGPEKVFLVVGGVAEQWGPFAPGTLLPFVATAGPSATLSPSAPFPVVVVIGRTWLRRFRDGARRASPVARRVLVIVPPLITPPEWTPRLSALCGAPCCLRPPVAGSASGLVTFEATSRSLPLRPDDSLPILRWVCRRASGVRSPSALPSSYGAPDCYPGGSGSH